MTKYFFKIFLFLFLSISVKGQENKKVSFVNLRLNEYDEIIITDHQNLNYDWYYGRVFKIIHNNNNYRLYQIEQYDKPYQFGITKSPNNHDTLDFDKMLLLKKLGLSKDSMNRILERINIENQNISEKRFIGNSSIQTYIKEIPYEEIQSLEKAINSKKECFINFTFSTIGIDSTWLDLNAERLFKSYNSYKSSKKATSRCISCIKDIEKIKKSSYLIYAKFTLSDYPYCEIKLMNKSDTITISTNRPSAYMLPWDIDGKYDSFNPMLSIAFGNILPDSRYSNKHRLTGEEAKRIYEQELIEEVIDNYCRNEKSFKKLKK